MNENLATIVRAEQPTTTEFAWGRITFFASEEIGSCPEQSVGMCEIDPGMALPKHYHPNCSEVVHVLRGRIAHTVREGEVATLGVGDTIVVPRNLAHQATNVGEETAVLLISFSTGRREFIQV